MADSVKAFDKWFFSFKCFDSVYQAASMAWQAREAAMRGEIDEAKRSQYSGQVRITELEWKIAQLEARIKESQEQEPVAYLFHDPNNVTRITGFGGTVNNVGTLSYSNKIPVYAAPIVGEKK